MSSATDRPTDELSPFPVRRFTVQEYRRLGELGVLTEDDRVELLEGWVVPKRNHNPAHDGTVSVINGQMSPCLPAGWIIRIQSAITTGDSEPEPDVAVVRGPARRYMRQHPSPTDIALAAEVAESSLSRDRGKCRLYARAGIAVYWIVNLVDRRIEVYTEPTTGLDAAPAYSRRQDFGVNDEVPLVIGGQRIAGFVVRDLLP